jgi:ribosome biogenesis protein Nip4
MFYISNLDEYGNFNCLQNLNIKNNTLNIKIKKEFKKELFYMKNIRKKSLKSGCFYRHIIKNFEKILKRKRSCNYSILNFKKCSLYNKNLKKHSQKNINLEEKFIYFPLHLQPELTSYILGEKFSDQLLAIEKLSKLIPNDWKIYIKENPKQTHYQRDELFFKRLKKIKNAILVDKHTNTYTLIEKSQFVSTISGTAGWEAISGGKNVLIFGKAWYQNLDGVFKFDNNFKLDAILNYKIEHQKLEKELNKLLSSSFNGIIDENYKQIFNSFDEQENKKNIYFALKTILKEIK